VYVKQACSRTFELKHVAPVQMRVVALGACSCLHCLCLCALTQCPCGRDKQGGQKGEEQFEGVRSFQDQNDRIRADRLLGASLNQNPGQSPHYRASAVPQRPPSFFTTMHPRNRSGPSHTEDPQALAMSPVAACSVVSRVLAHTCVLRSPTTGSLPRSC